MSLYFSIWKKLAKRLEIRAEIYLRGFRVLVPIFVVVGSGISPLERGGTFSELANLPKVSIVEQVVDLPSEEILLSSQVDSEHDIQRIRCRWQIDRVMISSLGQQKSINGIPPHECTETNERQVIAREENREVREKVILLASDEYPIAEMAGSISTYDASIAGLIVGIAKKESNWGKRTPKLHGEECFNYWGYRGHGNRGITEDGYGCFEKSVDAVNTIGNRLIELSDARGSTDPERMIVWKCGSSCATHSPVSVQKWISDVKLYYQQFAGVSE